VWPPSIFPRDARPTSRLTMDRISREQRSANMRRIRSKNTGPELVLRRLIHGLGYRFRLHRKDLPGRPDLVFPGRRKVIFAHGCFWHQHAGCREGRIPGTRRDYWTPKLKGNQTRDAANRALLEEQGWKVLVIWECDLKDPKSLSVRVKRFLGGIRQSTANKHNARNEAFEWTK
jgi:DNA mismatch endonuclease (patch repair protein)